MMQGDTGCGEHSVCWWGQAGEDLGVGRPAGWLDNRRRRQRGVTRGTQWESAFTGHSVLGFCWMRRVERESK